MPRLRTSKYMNRVNNSSSLKYGVQVAVISIGVILGIVTAILASAFIFFGDLIKTFFLIS